VSNWEKSYGLASMRVRYALPVLGEARVEYTYMPNYLIRYYRSPETAGGGDYAPCRYTEHLARVSLSPALGPLVIAPAYGYEVDKYIGGFDVYDTRVHRMGGCVRFSSLRNLRLAGEYEFRLASAAGPVPDISYDQHEAGFRLVAWPERLSQFGVEAAYRFSRRTFTTANPAEIDPGHAGRVDDESRAGVELSYRLGRARLSAGYELEWREVRSAYRQQIEDVKDYRRSRLSVGVRVGSAKRATGSGEE
jgi:hypothetical protein